MVRIQDSTGCFNDGACMCPKCQGLRGLVVNVISPVDFRTSNGEPAQNREQIYFEFFDSCACLFVEGVEFMTKEQIYQAIKKDFRKAVGKLRQAS